MFYILCIVSNPPPPPHVIKYLTQSENAILAIKDIKWGNMQSRPDNTHNAEGVYIKEASGNI